MFAFSLGVLVSEENVRVVSWPELKLFELLPSMPLLIIFGKGDKVGVYSSTNS
jgi:hypothetical protein